MTKRVVALVATAVMMVGMIVPAMAGGQVTTAVEKGTITVHKYSGNRASMIDNYTGEKLTDSEVASKLTSAGYKPLAGVKFRLYKADATQLADIATAMRDNVELKITGHTIDTSGADPKITFITSHFGTEFVVETEEYLDEGTTNSDGVAKFGNGNIPNGYYVLKETGTPTGYTAAAPSLIQLPLTDAKGNFNYDVHVYPKNVSTTNLVKKDMDSMANPVKADDVLNFDLKLKFKNEETHAKFKVDSAANLTDGTSYGTARITDILSDSLEYVAGSVKVYWLDSEGELDIAGGVMPAANYKVDDTKAGAGEIKIDLTTDGIDEAQVGPKTGFGVALQAKYVGTPVADQVEQKISNKMIGLVRPYTWNEEDPEDPSNPEPPEVIDEVFAPSLTIKVNKEDGDSGELMEGVTFALATKAVPVPYDPKLSYASGVLADNYVMGADNKPITGMTNNDGSVFFSRLEGYNNATGAKFYLKEIETADGYKLKMNTIEVKFENKAYYEGKKSDWFEGGKWKQGVEILATANVKNYKFEGTQDPDELGFSLPLTGGAGTIMFTIIGATVMLGAAMLIIKRKKKEA